MNSEQECAPREEETWTSTSWTSEFPGTTILGPPSGYLQLAPSQQPTKLIQTPFLAAVEKNQLFIDPLMLVFFVWAMGVNEQKPATPLMAPYQHPQQLPS